MRFFFHIVPELLLYLCLEMCVLSTLFTFYILFCSQSSDEVGNILCLYQHISLLNSFQNSVLQHSQSSSAVMFLHEVRHFNIWHLSKQLLKMSFISKAFVCLWIHCIAVAVQFLQTIYICRMCVHQWIKSA